MPITIQEIIASDTISQLVDKTNFNFDQLLLNGGGPAGPAGPAGPTGPAGGRGEKGSTWYEDTSSTLPGTIPTTSFPTATPLEADYYLQLNGQVWEYTGLTWSSTTINLTGPTGPAGAAGQFGLITGYQAINNLNTIYSGPIGTAANGATADNEGVPSIMMGGVASDTTSGAITLTAAYKVPATITLGLASNIAAVLVHQKDSNGRSILFHGGAADPAELYEQTDITQLSGIFIGTDDTLILNVPKIAPTAPSAQADLRGIELLSEYRSQYFQAGSDILMQTGVNTAFTGSQHSNFEISVGTAGNAGGNKFIARTAGTAGTTLTEAGNIATLATTASFTGKWQVQSGEIRLITSPTKQLGLYSGGELLLTTISGSTNTGAIQLLSGTGGITSTTNNGNITLELTNTPGGTTRTILIQNQAQVGSIKIESGVDIILSKYGGTSQVLLKPSIVLDYGSAVGPNTRFVGRQEWTPALGGATSVQLPTGVSRYTNPTSVLNTVASILDLVGNSTLTDMYPGAWLKKWEGGTQALSGVAAGAVGVVLGNEWPGFPALTAEQELMWDNSLQLTARNSANTKEYLSASIAKIAIAAPLVHKRNNDLNSVDNNNPTQSIVGSGYIDYGFCTGQLPYPVNTANGGSIDGMPTSAQTKIPMLTLGFGRSMPYYNFSSAINTNSGYVYTFNFPPGLYPGQQLYLRILHYADDFTADIGGIPRPHKAYGTINIRIPQTRRRLVPPYGATSNQQFSDWISTNGGTTSTTNPASYKEIKSSTSSVDAEYGIVKTDSYLMIWDGGKTTQRSWNPALISGGTPAQLTETELQFGWTIIPQGDNSVTAALNYSSSYCFAMGALVELFSGEMIAIELVKVGDVVKSNKNGKVVKGIVTNTLIHPTNDVVPVIKLNGITAEPNHPILVNGKWIAAKELGNVSYEFIDNWYNLEIDGNTEDSEHNYTIGGLVASGLGDNVKLNAKYQRQQKQLTQHLNA